MRKAIFVIGDAEVVLQGEMRLVDEDGEVEKFDLGELGKLCCDIDFVSSTADLNIEQPTVSLFVKVPLTKY